MPILTHDDMLRLYSRKVKEDYPNLTEEDIVKMCKSLFNFVKEVMNREEPHTIRLKYLGQFTVFPSRMENLIKDNLKSLNYRKVDIPLFEEKNIRYQKVLQMVLDAQVEKEHRLLHNRLNEMSLNDDFEIIDDES